MSNPLDTLVWDNLIGGDNAGLVTKGITLLSGAGSLKRGTVLGKVRDAGVTETHASNTGNGVMGAITRGAATIPGVYTLEIRKVVADKGDFVITDPKGNEVGQGSVATAFASAHLNFTLADGSTDFIVGDKFLITVAAGSGKYVKVLSTNVDGSDVPDMILAQDADATSADVLCPAYAAGQFNEGALIFGGSDTIDTVVAGISNRDKLRTLGIHVRTAVTTKPGVG